MFVAGWRHALLSEWPFIISYANVAITVTDIFHAASDGDIDTTQARRSRPRH